MPGYSEKILQLEKDGAEHPHGTICLGQGIMSSQYAVYDNKEKGKAPPV